MFKRALTWLIWKTLPSCKDVTAIVSDSLETDLSWRQKLTMKFHLWSCLACNRYLSQLKFMSKVFEIQEKNFKERTTPTLSNETAERLKDALKSTKFLILFALASCL